MFNLNFVLQSDTSSSFNLTDLVYYLKEIESHFNAIGIPTEKIKLQVILNEKTNQREITLDTGIGMTLQEKYALAMAKKDLYPKLWAVQWEKSERGQGCQPDGYSFHTSEQDAFQFIKEYQDKLPKEVPDEYSRVIGKPILAEVSYDLYDRVSKKGSVWLHVNELEAYKHYSYRRFISF